MSAPRMFKYDIFVSYAHLDNKPVIPDPDAKSWVNYFEYTLARLYPFLVIEKVTTGGIR